MDENRQPRSQGENHWGRAGKIEQPGRKGEGLNLSKLTDVRISRGSVLLFRNTDVCLFLFSLHCCCSCCLLSVVRLRSAIDLSFEDSVRLRRVLNGIAILTYSLQALQEISG